MSSLVHGRPGVARSVMLKLTTLGLRLTGFSIYRHRSSLTVTTAFGGRLSTASTTASWSDADVERGEDLMERSEQSAIQTKRL